LENGFGEHNIQGIGDKHVPLIHNVMGTDYVVGVTDRATDGLNVLAGTDEGRRHLVDRRGVPGETVAALSHLGLSSWCNVIAAVKIARHLGLGRDDAIVTVATDGASLYGSERAKTLATRYSNGFGPVDAAEVFAEHLGAASDDHLLDLTARERNRIFNLGYYTWVEQQGVPVDVFERRRAPGFWSGLRPLVDQWDGLLAELNGRAALAS
jgi:hypothetical protein